MQRRALLIGASRYGNGFIDLPADADVALMRQTLLRRNFSVEIADDATTGNATLLDRKIVEFCASSASGVSIVYFSGHGMSVDQQDWIIPAGVNREDAVASVNQRVPTDQSHRVAGGGVVLFIVDACRDEDQMNRSGQSSWSTSSVANRSSNFFRLFGCSAGEACHVLRSGHEGKNISLFTKALSIALSLDSPVDSLDDLRDAVTRVCKRLGQEANPRLPVQSPRVNFAGDRPTAEDDPLRLRLFADRVSGPVSFGPDKLNCLVIDSEHAQHDAGPLLSERVNQAFSKAGAAIWREFRDAFDGVAVVDGSVRKISASYEPAARVIDVRSIAEIFDSDASLQQTVLAAMQADLAFFDVSRFEPGVMFLIGVRAAVRRGVTLCSHGLGWREGKPLDKPFNLSDLQIFSHVRVNSVGPDPVVQRFADGIQQGFRQLKHQPRYQDLPAFEALRELGPGADASGTIPWDAFVLMLCSFREEHLKGWLYVRGKLEDALQARGTQSPSVQRLIDTGSPQLVSQALYEGIRRASACIVDWSYYSPSTFLELGVRLVVSPWGAMQIIDERFLPGAELAPLVQPANPALGPEFRQLTMMVKRFEPKPYRIGGGAPFDALLAELVDRRPFDEEEPSYNRIHRLIQNEIASTSPAMPRVFDMMRRAADTLSDAQQDRRAASQVLFSGNGHVKRDRETAALEYRIAAWLYLEHRAAARSRPEGDGLRELHKSLGQIVATALYETGDDDDFRMAEHIERLSKSETSS
jgi:hypothetical protein